MMNDTKETREILTEMRDETLPNGERGEHTALTAALAALDKVAEYEEMMANTVQIIIVDPDLPDRGTEAHSLFNVGVQWLYHDGETETKHESAYKAFKAIKEQK
jgi:hypothetical protein